jgi:hypothetical protein
MPPPTRGGSRAHPNHSRRLHGGRGGRHARRGRELEHLGRRVGRGRHVVKGKGKTLTAIRPTVVRFRNLLGPNNGGAPGGDPAGYREINWDSVPDELAAPYALPADFFNAATDPRARGIVLNTPGDHVAVSADRDNPSGARVRFGDVNPTYARQFKAFSAERLFSPIGSNVVNVTFFVPGTDTPGVVNSFGAVYTDVDRPSPPRSSISTRRELCSGGTRSRPGPRDSRSSVSSSTSP